jgi:hypothetical protein
MTMSDAKQVVKRQMERSGNTLFLGLEPLTNKEFFKPNANGVSAAWTIGHLSCVADLFSSWFDNELMFGVKFHRVFNETAAVETNTVARMKRVRESYPKADLLLRFRQAIIKVMHALDAFDVEQWDAPGPLDTPISMPTGGTVWELLAVHIYWHCGELAGSMERFHGTYTLNIAPHYFFYEVETS